MMDTTGAAAKKPSSKEAAKGCAGLIVLLVLAVVGIGSCSGDSRPELTAQQSFDQILAANKPCDDGWTDWAKSMDQATRDQSRLLDVLVEARKLEETCKASWLGVGQVKVPNLPEDLRAQWRKAVEEQCSDVPYSRYKALQVFNEKFTTDPMGAAVGMKENARPIGAAYMMCVGGLAAAASAGKQPLILPGQNKPLTMPGS